MLSEKSEKAHRSGKGNSAIAISPVWTGGMLLAPGVGKIRTEERETSEVSVVTHGLTTVVDAGGASTEGSETFEVSVDTRGCTTVVGA